MEGLWFRLTVSMVGTMMVLYSASGSSALLSRESIQGDHLLRVLSNMKSYTCRGGGGERGIRV